MYKAVMEFVKAFDALLADLQSTTGHVNQYQRQAPTQYQQQDQGYRARSETPPPLPPPPPQDVLDSIPPPRQFDEPLYEGQQISVTRGRTPSSSTSRSSGHSYPERSTSSPAPRQMSSISNNLTELDQLLQDLNSAQFMAEVDKRNSANQPLQQNGVINDSNKPPAPQVAPKPNRSEKRNTVDNLLDQLENALPDGPRRSEEATYDYTLSHTANNAGFPQSPPPPVHQPVTKQASTATRELDDLMATLSEFKVSGQQQPPVRAPSPNEPSYAKPNKSKNVGQGPMSSQGQISNAGGAQHTGELESMLGDIQSKLSEQGVTTKTKGLCGACNQPVIGQVITALGKVWHIEHFVCDQCKVPLGTKNFYERDGAAFCEEDYHRIFAPKCSYCNGPIVDKCVTALGSTWHPEHFFCAQCGRPFGEDGFHEMDGKAYCRDDYLEMFAPRCGGCGRPILDNYISALSRHWHPDCFACRDCGQPFGGRSFFEHEGLPYCETHYHAKRGSLCASCQKPISGRCITAMFKKFHPEHFVCAFCLKQLNKGTFKEQNDKPYCHPCFVKLFG
ncbi:leupaxin-like isoform X3 [Mytilus galloprovincialis]|uniref:leupaxin-like isoform X3 n=1 Tax=Mytilus galloprovincialis TaxID=29158 RepID=UPI003F7C8EF9